MSTVVAEKSAANHPDGSKTGGSKTQKVKLESYDLINSPRLNKGTAFTEHERDAFGLNGLLPPHVGTLDEQRERRKKAFDNQPTPFAKYTLMRDLQDTNETLFYSLITKNVREMLPVVYTPTVGEGCQRFSEIWRRPRGLFLSYPNRDKIEQILASPRYDGVRCIVVSDGERILGLGDQGAGGMGIPIGKMALYTALAGIAPESCLPILLDVGTNRKELLEDPLYIGWRHERVRGQEYDDFVQAFVDAVKKRWPHVLLQWEDFAGSNAARLLERYRNELCTFNDDIQGTAAVTAATLMSALTAADAKLADQKVAVVGFGSAGLGISNLIVSLMQDEGLSAEEAHQRFYALDMHGLLTEDSGDLREGQKPYARKSSEVSGWKKDKNGEIGLAEVVRQAQPTVLLGVSGQAGIFNEEVVREMAKHVERPVIFPLSNPTSRSEATPQQLLDWTDGKALIGTGSPFDPVKVKGKEVAIDQTNNSYIFPGLALGIVATRSRHVSDGMIRAASKALADLSPVQHDRTASLLPPLEHIRAISRGVAAAVGRQAIQEGLAQIEKGELDKALDANIWEPAYLPYEPA